MREPGRERGKANGQAVIAGVALAAVMSVAASAGAAEPLPGKAFLGSFAHAPIGYVGPDTGTPPEQLPPKPDPRAPTPFAQPGPDAWVPPDLTNARKPFKVPTALLDIGASFELGGRRFGYSDPLSKNLRPYDVFGAPTFGLRGEIYPAADAKVPVLSDLGLTAAYVRAFGLDSKIDGGEPIGTSWSGLDLGLRYRFRLSDEDGPVIGLGVAYSTESFSFDDAPKALDAELPNVSYDMVRVGLDGRVPVWRFAGLAGFNYLGVLSAGDVSDRFRDARVGAIEAHGGIAFTIVSGFEARLAFRYARYFYAFGPEPGDAYVAGGSLDELFGIGLGAHFIY